MNDRRPRDRPGHREAWPERDEAGEASSPRPAPVRGALGFAARGALAAVLALLVAAVCVRLGFWQLERLEQRQQRNSELQRALALPPLRLDSAGVEALLRDPERFQFRRVRARGEYATEAEVVLRGRSLDGSPGVNLLTPLRIADSRWSVVVNRGWAPSADALTLDPRPLDEPGVREVEGIVELFPAGVREGRPLEHEVGRRRFVSVQRMDPEILQRRLLTPLLPRVYIQQLPGGGAPADVRRLPIPQVSEGPHLGYAVQWFSFAAIALVGLLILALRSRRRGA